MSDDMFSAETVAASENVDNSMLSIFSELKKAFEMEDDVVVGILDFKEFIWPSGNPFIIDQSQNNEIAIALVLKVIKDRTCLSTGNLRKNDPKVLYYNGIKSVDILVDYVNHHCNTYRNKNGYLTIEGIHRKAMLDSLFYVENVTSVDMSCLTNDSSERFCSRDSCKHGSNKSSALIDQEGLTFQEEINEKKLFDFKELEYNIQKCDKITIPSKEKFFNSYLSKSKPVIIKDAVRHWPAFKKWTNEFFKRNYGAQRVHVKLTPLGEFEGVDFAMKFENYRNFNIPPDVKQQLPFSDLVVVRPATANMNFSQFLHIVESVAKGERKGYSAYLEYSSIADITPELEDDISEMAFFEDVLELKHLNIWLSDGNTLGKLHFDPFDNFLCQISGKKQVILFDPHDNRKLYEAHIPEGMLGYNETSHTFSRRELVDSTSMVMSPVDILNPDFQRFPLFAKAHPLNCTIDEGEVLFMPAFWWHEVQSYPNREQGRNLAVNFWYEPFLQKEFPCQECKLDVNPKYRHLL